MPSLFSSLADKAQSAINASPLAGHLPASLSSHLGGTHAPPDQPSANEAAAQGGIGAKSHTLGNLQHQFRSLQMQYSSASPVQKIITTQKGVALDFDSTSRDSKSHSRELYMWGQTEDEDLKDVTDRLAYLNFVHGSIAEKISASLDASRSSYKALRDAENTLTPRRNIRASLQTQIARIEHDQQTGMAKRHSELKQQLQQAENEDESAEKEVEILKRKAVRESEEIKWKALREYGEKLVLLAQASTSIIAALPSVPPTAAQPYTGTQATATTRSSLQKALDNYKPGSIGHSFQPSVADLNRSDSRSFGVTHASELSSIDTNASSVQGVPVTPPPTQAAHAPVPIPVAQHTAGPDVTLPAVAPTPNMPVPTISSAPASSPSAALFPTPATGATPIASASGGAVPVNPAALNNTPAVVPQPTSKSPSDGAVLRSPEEPTVAAPALPDVRPTVAETGLPLSAGPGGPGPATGSLNDLRAAPSTTPVSPYGEVPGYGAGVGKSASPYESADDEKKRLQREERERLLQEGAPPGFSSGSAVTQHPSAEGEKARLEREEREKLLNQGGSGGGNKGPAGDDGSTPPPYQDF